MVTTPSSESVRRAAAGGPDSRADSDWVARQVDAMVAAWRRGEPLEAEDLLARHPGLDDEAAVRLIYEEVCLRREAGHDVRTDEVVGRFPRWRDELELLLRCDRLLRPPDEGAAFPDVGESLGPFRLLAELGRGASGRTFLAVQPALADRPVVLKVIPSDQEEHLSLARLQHTHIVPLFSEQTFPDQGLRALCMPYLGGASLGRVLDALHGVAPGQRGGLHLIEALEAARSSPPAPPLDGGPFRRFLERATYVEAVCWIGACLADALQYAHDRGLIHMDIKPSNVLITGDGQPMLLDFHLARGPVRPGERFGERLGGTPGWMSPEQQAAMRALGEGRPVVDPVDRRTDVYSLGLLLREALGGAEAVVDLARPLRRCNPGVSVGLADIVGKCLAPAPADRYAEASALADDLRRHLSDLPLRGAPNRSLAERFRKWQRRRPGALTRRAAGLATLGAVVVAVGVTGAFYRERVREIESALKDGRARIEAHEYAEALRVLRHGEDLAGAVPLGDRLRRAVRDERQRARRGLKAGDLHDLADLIRFRHGLAPPSADEARILLRDCRAVWAERAWLTNPSSGALGPEAERRVRTDLLELAVVWADLRVRLSPPEGLDAARREALGVLDEADRAYGPSLALARERRAYAEALGLAATTDAPPPRARTAWEHYDLGRSYLRSGQVEAAAREFQRTLDLRPQDFWANFHQGLCAYQLGRYREAVEAFRACVALAPDAAECHYSRALALDALGEADAARRDYSRALELNPRLSAAALNRGILAYKAGRPRAALDDFDRALRVAGPDRATLGRIHYNRALARLADGDRASARADADRAVEEGCAEARALRDRLRDDP